jgi:hypothetical protein
VVSFNLENIVNIEEEKNLQHISKLHVSTLNTIKKIIVCFFLETRLKILLKHTRNPIFNLETKQGFMTVLKLTEGLGLN